MNPLLISETIAQAHALYGQLTGQRLSLRFDRERAWFEFLKAGYTMEDLRRVVTYLQKEIRAGRRNVGALKLSNLLQLDRFEEDWNISRVRLTPAQPPPASPTSQPEPLSPEEQEVRRLRAIQLLAQLRQATGL